MPPAVRQQLTSLAHDVFVSGYIDALKQTLVVPIAVLFLTAFSALLITKLVDWIGMRHELQISAVVYANGAMVLLWLLNRYPSPPAQIAPASSS